MLYGFDIGGTKIEIGVFDQNLNSLWTKRIKTPLDGYDSFLNSIVELVAEADHKFATVGQVGIGMPGFINNKRKIYSTNITAINQQPFANDLEKAIKRPIFINNDANCFAISEAFNDDFNAHQTILAVILGTGLGGGIVVNRQVLSGLNGCAGEIGHIRLPIDALNVLGQNMPILPCGCGLSGCAERYLSGSGFEWLYQYFYQQPLNAKQIIEQYYQGDSVAKQHVDRYFELLALYLGHLIMIVDAEVIVIGGGLSNFAAIYQEVPSRIAKYILPRMALPRLEKARFGDSGGTRGAALLCLKPLSIEQLYKRN
ncbi:N-acetylglucosamine kinase [Orbus sturtevantii]|uniref:N-acetylglucosamine kinase n=1 Tax=Orbus sturtevantii TaxID=3074109 RepID=UPI00370D9E62